jgi:ribosomal protein S13
MKKQLFFTKYGLNHSRLNNFYNKLGLSNFNVSFINKNLDEKLNKFLELNLEKKEILLKKNYLIFLKSLENGSIKGYKRFRGLPCKNQRTKTNSKTNRSNKK